MWSLRCGGEQDCWKQTGSETERLVCCMHFFFCLDIEVAKNNGRNSGRARKRKIVPKFVNEGIVEGFLYNCPRNSCREYSQLACVSEELEILGWQMEGSLETPKNKETYLSSRSNRIKD